MPQRLHVAVLQPELRWQQPMPNMFLLRQTIENLPSSVNVVVLPEMWSGLPHGQRVEDAAAQSRQFLQTVARAGDVNVVGGSLEQRAPDGALQNVCVVVNRHGDVVGEYAKRKLFARERDVHAPGQAPGVFEVDGLRIGILICADLWDPGLTAELMDRVDLLCVPAKTAVPSDQHVEYARTLWHSLTLTRAMEYGLPVAVSDWPAGRHAPQDVDLSVGSAHAPGMEYDRGVLGKRHRDHGSSPTASGPVEPSAAPHSTAAPALGAGVHFTAGAATICDPGHRPDITRIQRTLPRGEPGNICESIDLAALRKYRDYRTSVGLRLQTGNHKRP